MDGPKSLVLYAVRQAMRKYPLHREDMVTATCGAVGQMLHCEKRTEVGSRPCRHLSLRRSAVARITDTTTKRVRRWMHQPN